jgi:transposase
VALEGADRASDAVAVMVDRQRSAAATGAVVAQRREAEGMTNREIRRCLVRYVARQLYRLLEQPARFDAT